MTRRARAILWSASALAAIGAGALVVWLAPGRGRGFFSDAATIREEARGAPNRRVLWQPPVALAAPINTDAEEYEARVTADGQALFFVRGRAGNNADIFTCTRTRGGWSSPVSLDELNTSDDELSPEPSTDGLALYFASNRPGGQGGYDLWVSRRSDPGGAWTTPVNLGPAINSAADEYTPALRPDGGALYFASNRPRPGEDPADSSMPWPATIRANGSRHDFDLYVALPATAGSGGSVGGSQRPESSDAQPAVASVTPEEASFTSAMPLDALNTRFNDGTPAFSPAGDFLYFASDRPGGSGGLDLWRARLVRGTFQAPENLGGTVNSPYQDLDPAPGMGGFALHFSSNRPLAAADSGHPGDYNLFATSSREVFLDREARTTDWASLWSAILPPLLWLLLIVLMALLLYMLRGRLHDRKLSVLAKCLLASVFLHLLILFLLSLWGVTTSMGEYFRRGGGGGRVHLTSATGADSLAGQVRGSLTQLSVTAPATRPTVRPPEMQIQAPASVLARLDSPPLEIAPETLTRRPEARDNAGAPLPMPQLARPEPTGAPSISPVLPAESHLVRAEEAAPTVAPGTVQLAVSSPQPSVPGVRTSTFATAAPTLDVPIPAPDASVAGTRGSEAAPAPVLESNLPVIPGTEPGVAIPLPVPGQAAPPGLSEPTVAVAAPVIASGAQVAPTRQAPASVGSPYYQTPAALDLKVSPAPAAGSELRPVRDAPIEPGLSLSTGTPNISLPIPSVAGAEVRLPTELGVKQGIAEASSRPAGPASTSLRTLAPPLLSVVEAPILSGAPAMVLSGPAAKVTPFTPSAAAAPTASDAPAARTDSSAAIAFSRPDIPAVPRLDLAVPTETAPPEDQFAQRAPETRAALIERLGGSDRTEKAVAAALDWLSRHQSKDGRWSSIDFDHDCGECSGQPGINSDKAVTGLALLCFLGADHTHLKDGRYRDTVGRALKWLVAQQEDDGSLRRKESMYSHGIATIALCEARAMTHDPDLAEPTSKAVAFIVKARDPRSGGWRYEPGQVGDTSVLGWQVMALVSAKRAGIDVPQATLDSATRYLDDVSRKRAGLYSYQPDVAPSAAMTAEGLFVRQLLGHKPDEPMMHTSVDFVMRTPPRWDRSASTYFWYYATLAMFQQQGEPWKRWNKSLTGALLDRQRDDGAPAGSWDPVDRWSLIGGRVYQTAICTLCLEVYYRYLPMYASVPAGPEHDGSASSTETATPTAQPPGPP